MDISYENAGQLLSRLHLKPIQIYRSGPRFWVGHVSRDSQDYVLKVAVAHDEWIGQASGKAYRSSDRLANEIAMMDAVERSEAHIEGRVPRIVKASTTGGHIWVLREFTQGQSMSVGGSNFLFKPEFYEADTWRAAIAFALSLQKSTDVLASYFESRFDRSDYTTLAARVRNSGLPDPSPWLAPYANEVASWLAGRDRLYDQRCDVFVHGELYPPHIFAARGPLTVIDWENAIVGSRFQDLAAMWIRGHDNPSWQQAYVRELERRGAINSAEDRELWNTTTLLACISNLHHMYWHHNEPEAVKENIRSNLVRILETRLRPSHSAAV